MAILQLAGSFMDEPQTFGTVALHRSESTRRPVLGRYVLVTTKRAIPFLLFFLAAWFQSHQHVFGEFARVVAFGSSSTDSGNILAMSPQVTGYTYPPSPPYFSGRLTNGPNWVDVLADRLELDRPSPSLSGGTNYAFAGATTGLVDNIFDISGIDMDDQVSAYLSGLSQSIVEDLIVIQATGNDFSAGANDPALVADQMGKLVSDLAAAGARNMVVTNAFGTSEDFTPGAEYDRFLTAEYAEVKLSHPDLNLYHLNAMDIFDAIHSSAEAWGITRLSGAACQDCLTKENPVRVAANPNEFFSWDTIHATAPIHEALGNAAFAIISGEVPGDLNFDRSVSSKDIDVLAAAKRNDATAKLFDLNVDGRFDHDDIVHFVHNLAGSWFGDANLDGEFNTGDLVRVLEAGKYETSDYASWSEGDWNGDGVFDTGDLVKALEDGGYEMGPRADVAAVPEPHSLLLLVLGPMCLLTTKKPHRSRH